MRWPSGKILQEWEGLVVEVGEETFWVRLLDLTAGVTYADEKAEMRISDLRSSEAAFLQEGATFRWRIYENDGDAFSYLRFSRRTWTQRMMDRANRKASRLAAAIGRQ